MRSQKGNPVLPHWGAAERGLFAFQTSSRVYRALGVNEATV
jgi:hypothetical protein